MLGTTPLDRINAIPQEYKDSLMHVSMTDHCFSLPPRALNPKYCELEKSSNLVYSRILAPLYGQDDSTTLLNFRKYEAGLYKPLRIPLLTHSHTAGIDTACFAAALAEQLGVVAQFDDYSVRFSLPLRDCDCEMSGDVIAKKLLKFRCIGYYPGRDVDSAVNASADGAPEDLREAKSDDDAQPELPKLLPTESILQEYSCCICLEVMVDPTSLPCGHSGCCACIKDAITARAICPICRATVPRKYQLSVTVALRNAIDRLFKDHEEYQQRKAKAHEPVALVATRDGAKKMTYSDAMYAFGEAQYSDHMAVLCSDEARPLDPSVVGTDIFLGLTPQDFNCFLVERPPHPQTVAADMTVTREDIGISEQLEDESAPMVSRLCRTVGIYAEAPSFQEACAKTLRNDIENVVSEIAYSYVTATAPAIGCDSTQLALSPYYAIPYGYGGPRCVRYILSPYIVGVLKHIHPGSVMSSDGMSVLHDMLVDVIDRVMKLALVHAHGDATTVHTIGGDMTYDVCIPVPAGLAMTADSLLSHDICVLMAVPNRADMPTTRRGDRATVGEGGKVIRVCSILAAARGFLIAEILRHQVSEINKAVNKLNVPPLIDTFLSGKYDTLGSAAGLVYSPNQCALIASHLHGVVLTIDAAVGLASIVEYLTAEIVELSGNAANNDGSKSIHPVHIDSATRGDSELNAAFSGNIMSARCIDSGIFCNRALTSVILDTTTSFHTRLVALAQSAPGHIIVEPLSGRHIQLKPDGSGFRRRYLTYLDAACDLCAYQRAQVARGALSTPDLTLLLQETSKLTSCLSNRFVEIQSRGSDFVIDPWLFAEYVYSVSTEKFPSCNFVFTAEALQLMQKLVEWRILKSLFQAKKIMNYGDKLFPGLHEWKLLRHLQLLPTPRNTTPESVYTDEPLGSVGPSFNAVPSVALSSGQTVQHGGLGQPIAPATGAFGQPSLPSGGLFGHPFDFSSPGLFGRPFGQQSGRTISAPTPDGAIAPQSVQNATASYLDNNDGYSTDGSL